MAFSQIVNILQNFFLIIKIQTNLIEGAHINFNTKRLLLFLGGNNYPKNAKQPIKEEYLLSSELEKTNEWYAIAKNCWDKTM